MVYVQHGESLEPVFGDHYHWHLSGNSNIKNYGHKLARLGKAYPSLPDIAANPAPTDEVPLGLNLRIQNGFHSVVVQTFRLAQIDDGESIR